METGYQRGKIQEESMYYEHKKHDGSYPIIGVNTFRNPKGDPIPEALELARSTDEEKRSQLTRLRDFHTRHGHTSAEQLQRLQQAVLDNVFWFVSQPDDALADCAERCVFPLAVEAGEAGVAGE